MKSKKTGFYPPLPAATAVTSSKAIKPVARIPVPSHLSSLQALELSGRETLNRLHSFCLGISDGGIPKAD